MKGVLAKTEKKAKKLAIRYKKKPLGGGLRGCLVNLGSRRA